MRDKRFLDQSLEFEQNKWQKYLTDVSQLTETIIELKQNYVETGNLSLCSIQIVNKSKTKKIISTRMFWVFFQSISTKLF